MLQRPLLRPNLPKSKGGLEAEGQAHHSLIYPNQNPRRFQCEGQAHSM